MNVRVALTENRPDEVFENCRAEIGDDRVLKVFVLQGDSIEPRKVFQPNDWAKVVIRNS